MKKLNNITIVSSDTELFVTDFSDELIRLDLGDESVFVDKDNPHNVIRRRYDRVGDISEGLARVHSGDKYGYINNKAEEVISLQYKKVTDFGDGLAAVYT